MSSRASTTRRSGAASAISGQAVVINSSAGTPTLAGSSVTANTIVSIGVVTPGQTAAQSTVQTTAPIIANVQYLYANYVVSPATAVSTAGGNILINGTGFVTGSNVFVNGTAATATFINSTSIRALVPASTPGNATLTVFSPTNSGTFSTISYSGAPVWTTTAISLQNNTAANVTLVASSDSTLTYTLQAGSTLPTGMSLISTGYISGTPTGYTTETASTAVIVATDLENQATQQTINFTVSVGDPQFNYVTALVNGETSVTPFIADASTNDFALTIAGDTRATKYTPYSDGYYSNYFDGSGDALTTPANAGFGFGTGDFTVEFWVNFSVTTGRQDLVWWGVDASDRGGLIWNISAGNLTYYVSPTVGNAINYTWTPSAGVWYHIALVRISGSTNLYINGTPGGSTYSDSKNYSNSNLITVGKDSSALSSYLTGYMSNLRIVKGTGVYTASFTPPTSPLTAINNTSLLTCQSNRLIDNSSNNLAITKVGDTTVSPASPFGTPTTAAYNTLYSTYFDGSGDYLSLPTKAGGYLTSGNNFTVEAWIYLTNWPQASVSAYGACVAGTSGSSNGWEFVAVGSTGSNSTGISFNMKGIASASYTTPLTLNTWYHVAAVKNGSTLSVYVNGVLGATTATLTSWTDNTTLYVGADTAPSYPFYFTGNISNFRIVNGTAIYTSAFTPPTAPLTAVTNTVLLTCQNSTLIDNSTNAFTITSNGNAQPIAVSPFTMTTSTNTLTALGSGYFDGTGDYLSVPASTGLGLGTGDFTIEYWVNLASFANTPNVIDFRASSPGDNAKASDYYTSSGAPVWYVNATIIATSSITLNLNTWNHVAFTRSGTTVRIFVNGVVGATATSALDLGASQPLRIGNNIAGTAPITGFVSNLRVIKGTALYTSNFLPPQTPLSAVANTQLLTVQYNGAGNNNGFIDSSIFQNLVTRAGNTTQGSFTPFSQTGWSNYTGTTAMGWQTPASSLSNIIGSSGLTSTSTFTIEAWINQTTRHSLPANAVMCGDMTIGSTTNYFSFGPNNSGLLQLYWYDGATKSCTGNTTIQLNVWTHIAVSISAGSIKLFVNGNLETLSGTTTTTNASGTTGYFTFGGYLGNAGAWSGYNGYISNMRIVKSALYSSTFTPSTTPLTAVANTSFLTAQSNRFIDNSTNNFALTVTGTPSVQAYSPFAPSSSYGTSTVGGSGYFDGTGDYLSVPSSTAFALGTGDFTVEWWYYPLDSGVLHYLLDIYDGNSAGRFLIQQNTNMSIGLYGASAALRTASSANALVANQWNHIAFCRSSGSTRIFTNGIQVNTTYADTNNYTCTTSNLYFGTQNASATAGAGAYGFDTDFRILKGTALYTTNFTPPTAPLTAVANTSLLFNFTNAGIVDAHSSNDAETVGNAQLNTSITKFGTASMAFDGTGDYLAFKPGPNPNFAMGSGDWTIEMWMYPTSAAAVQLFFDIYDGNSAGRLTLQLNTARTIGLYGASGAARTVSTGTVTLNQWQHIAFCKSNGSTRIFIGGVQVNTTYTDSNTYTCTTGAIYLAANGTNGGNNFFGYIDDFRITKGFARYTANFTPPTTGFLGQ